MRLSQSLTKPLRERPAEADSANAAYLIQGGFIDQLGAGIYNLLPFGWRVYRKVAQIIREEMDALGAQELNLAALHPTGPWKASGRWDDPEVRDVMYQFKDQRGKDYGLGFTHEEIAAQLAKPHIQSYRDLPQAFYQIQVKFRNEPRAKSGVLRGREFMMKDLYSFHADEADRDAYYDRVLKAYPKIFKRLGLDALTVEASGGVFTKYSHEFQVLAGSGEDTVHYTEDGSFAQNDEIFDEKNVPKDAKNLKKSSAIEVGNIFKLGKRFPEAAGVAFLDKQGNRQVPEMCSYGIGPTRCIGTVVETSHDDNGIIWPAAIAPFAVHIVALGDDADVTKAADKLYADLEQAGVEVLYDDRDESAGVKFNDADLVGIPQRVTVSKKTLEKQSAELKRRDGKKVELVELGTITKKLTS
ncbi:MAG: aminoacyl--tRNA ligase-related protein [Patescibacteria group bacterium]